MIKYIFNLFRFHKFKKDNLDDAIEFEIPENAQYNPRIPEIVNALTV